MKVFMQRFALFATLTAAGAWALGRPLGWFSGLENTPEGFVQLERLLSVVLALASALAIYEVLRTYEKSEEQDQRQKIADSVRRIEKHLQRGIDVVSSPSTLEEYIGLWSGFTDIYWAYNPCFQVEYRPGIDQAEVIQKVFVPRYRDPKFKKAYYLFLTKDDAGKKDLNDFRAIIRETRKACPHIVKKLEVKVLADKSSNEDSEVYRGTKNGILTSVVEPREQALTGGRGAPFYYLVVTDPDINKRLKDQFERDWSQATKVDIFKDPVSESELPLQIRRLTTEDVKTIRNWPAYPSEFSDLDYALREKGWLDQFPERSGNQRYAASIGSKLVGFSILTQTNPKQAEFYIALHPDHLGRGYGRGLTKQTLAEGFRVIGLEKIHLKVRAWHAQGIHLYSSVGFRKVGEKEIEINGKKDRFLIMEKSSL